MPLVEQQSRFVLIKLFQTYLLVMGETETLVL